MQILKYLLPLYVGAALGPIGGFGVVTLLPVMAREWAVDFGTASLAISFYMAPFSLFFAYIGILTFTADYLKSNIQLASDQVGAVLSITGFSGIIVSPLAGFLGDRFGRQKIFLTGIEYRILNIA
jgi:predicted MFS family arabinose efflux permease